MTNIHLPEPVYERLPLIYSILAALLAFSPLGTLKWTLIAGLVLATVVVKRRRSAYRDAEMIRTSTQIMEKYATARRR